jgi:hypothetical protein
LLPLGLRKYLHRIHLSDWKEIPFPHWPVDSTVDDLLKTVLAVLLKSNGLKEIPFIWFWPNGAEGCSIMTHDVEAEPGKQYISQLMDIDDSFNIPASFQIVPEKRYTVEQELLESIRRRGFEVNVQDLDHDGRLFQDKNEFTRRLQKLIGMPGNTTQRVFAQQYCIATKTGITCLILNMICPCRMSRTWIHSGADAVP